jgi:hypothetical protein
MRSGIAVIRRRSLHGFVVMFVFGCPVFGGGQQLRSAAVVECATRPGRAARRSLAVNLRGLYACAWAQTGLSSVPCCLWWLLKFMNGGHLLPIN